MRIAVDLTPIYDHLTGVERYNINITKGLIVQHPEDTFILVFKNEVHKEFLDIVELKNVNHVILQACNKLLFMQIRLLKAMNHIKADYYLFLSFTSPLFFRKKRTISAIHDLTCWDCPETIPTKMKYYYRLTYKASIKNDWKTVTVSKFSQRRICEKYRIADADVPVIYDGLSDIFKQGSPKSKSNICEKYRIPENYILSLSTIEPRKNLQLLISAYQGLSDRNLPNLVLAGRKGWKLEEILNSVDQKTKEKIYFTDFVDDVDLPGLYAGATLFVFPSKYEGFGLPVIEAMSQGTLVLSSDAASLPEVIGDSGVLFKSEDKEDLMTKILFCLSLSDKEKERITETAKQIAFSFNWSHEAEKLHKVMKYGQENLICQKK